MAWLRLDSAVAAFARTRGFRALRPRSGERGDSPIAHGYLVRKRLRPMAKLNSTFLSVEDVPRQLNQVDSCQSLFQCPLDFIERGKLDPHRGHQELHAGIESVQNIGDE